MLLLCFCIHIIILLLWIRAIEICFDNKRYKLANILLNILIITHPIIYNKIKKAE